MAMHFSGEGFCGTDPEVKEISGGRKLVTFNIGVPGAKDDQVKGERYATAWFNVAYFASGSDDFVVRQVTEGKMRKGTSVSFIGEITQRTFEGANGSAVGTNFQAAKISYGSGGGSSSDGESSSNSGGAEASSSSAAASSNEDFSVPTF